MHLVFLNKANNQLFIAKNKRKLVLKTTILGFISILFIGCATTSKSNRLSNENGEIVLVKKEIVSGKNFDVYFFDPTFLILRKFPNHNTLDDAAKNDQWFEYLQNNVVYVFALSTESNIYSKYFIIRGNPEITQSAYFYKMDILTNDGNTEIVSIFDGYETKKSKVIDNLPTRGSLFEHMSFFKSPEGKKYVGQGVKFYGSFMNVTKYEEVKNAVLPIIQKESGE